MQRIFSSPHIIDLVLALTVLEALALLLARRRLGLFRSRPHKIEPPVANSPGALEQNSVADQGMPPIGIVLMLLPGVFLMLAIRAALDGAAWPWVPAALAAALVAHIADLRGR